MSFRPACSFFTATNRPPWSATMELISPVAAYRTNAPVSMDSGRFWLRSPASTCMAASMPLSARQNCWT